MASKYNRNKEDLTIRTLEKRVDQIKKHSVDEEEHDPSYVDQFDIGSEDEGSGSEKRTEKAILDKPPSSPDPHTPGCCAVIRPLSGANSWVLPAANRETLCQVPQVDQISVVRPYRQNGDIIIRLAEGMKWVGSRPIPALLCCAFLFSL